MYPDPYIDYLVYFHGHRDYFECHEVLEEYWKKDKKGERKNYWVALIQVAVALYHHRRNNFNGALKMLKNAISIIEKEKESIQRLGIDYAAFIRLLKERYDYIKNHKPYTSMNFPINDDFLLNKCKEKCTESGYCWGAPSDLTNKELVSKHSLRDRSDIIAFREEMKNEKRRKK